MSAAEQLKMTPEEYLEMERAAETKSEYADGEVRKWEYVDGEVFAMAGATVQHTRIARNLSAELHAAMKDRPCEVLGLEAKVWLEVANTFAYPDVSGRCGPFDFYDDRQDIYTNPQFIIEILSDSTEAYDRGDKFTRYQTLPSLEEYVLVSQRSVSVEIFRRHEAGWLYNGYRELTDELHLASVDCRVPLAEIYRDVEFGTPADE